MTRTRFTWSVEGLPLGASLVPDVRYGHATLSWTPTATDLGSRDVVIVVRDAGLPPQDAGYPVPENPTPNETRHTVRIVVREHNDAPELLGLEVNGLSLPESDPAQPVQLQATEGVPLVLDFFGQDADADLIEWRVEGLPGSMRFMPEGNRATLSWTPDFIAAQEGNTGTPGLWRLTLTGSDGSASLRRVVEIAVANVNQAPVILPVTPQLANEGETIRFAVRAADGDGDAVRLEFLYDDETPEGVLFDAVSGEFEWRPGQEAIDNAQETQKTYTLTFRASDGKASSDAQVSLRLFDVNRAPEIVLDNHALAVGEAGVWRVLRDAGSESSGIRVWDPDGARQTEALTVSFENLPEGAQYDALTGELSWTPGPGQIGDHAVTAIVSDGMTRRTAVFVLRVVADATASGPTILIATTPGIALPGQTVIVTVRGESWSAITDLRAELCGPDGLWQDVALDAAGRLRLTPEAPGVLDLRVTATDRDGFTTTKTHRLRVRDAADTQAPELWWGGILGAAGTPVLADALTLTAGIAEAQLMGWTLTLQGASSRVIAQGESAAQNVNGLVELAQLDPRTLPNGIYHLRLNAWDLSGRAQEIETEIRIDTPEKAYASHLQTDATVPLAGHTLVLTRECPAGPADGADGATADGMAATGDLGDWHLPLLETWLTHDQPSGMTPWQDGARVWITVPAELAPENGTTQRQALSFTLSAAAEALGDAPKSCGAWRRFRQEDKHRCSPGISIHCPYHYGIGERNSKNHLWLDWALTYC